MSEQAKVVHLFQRQEHLAPVNVPLQAAYDIEQFLYAEAELLDAWQFHDWLALMAPDVHYWAPVRENRLAREMDREMYPPGTAAHFDENLQMLGERVNRLHTNMAWSETPPSRTRHLISNVRAHTTEPDNEFDVQSSFHVYRTSSERHQDSVIGRRFDRLRRADSVYGFQIVSRTVVFDMATLLVKNLSLFY
ncbi:3-phenylpropionate/cinnamic acid dioxygenase subunit beta [Immundisolibacter sp.]|uniref:aromatic-ring-hydroxylating dioxygenase subunit beta n=1 Tax=Immundisolibacter sp. TaxID=1934948 RepID=UPI003562A4D1